MTNHGNKISDRNAELLGTTRNTNAASKPSERAPAALAPRSGRIFLHALTGAAIAAAGACGSDDEPGSSAHPACQIGETRTCVGPGACAGGQVCLPDRSGFGVCDCALGTGGKGGSAAQSGTAGAPSGGEGGASGGSGGTGGSPIGGTGGLADSGAGAGGTSGSAGGTGGIAGASGGEAGAAGSGGSSGSAGSSGGGAAGASNCVGLPGPKMIDIGGWCIDESEVTNAQYAQFLAAKGTDMTGQPGLCDPKYPGTGNPSYEPTKTTDCSQFTGFDPVNKPSYPVTCVDWCDAYAYCKWAGKRLCGKIGGGTLGWNTSTGEYEATNYALSEWANTCSNGGQTLYPYGNTPMYSKCGIDPWAPVMSYPDCHGMVAPYSSVFDMPASAGEWVDSNPHVFMGMQGSTCKSLGSENPAWVSFRCCL